MTSAEDASSSIDTTTQPYAEELQQLPRLNLGALFMPAIWGPTHGYWVTILFYPLWIFADTAFCNAFWYGGLATVLAATVALGTAAFMIYFAATAGKRAYLRVAGKIAIDKYLRREKIWIFVSAAIAILFIALATWYNLAIRMPAGPAA